MLRVIAGDRWGADCARLLNCAHSLTGRCYQRPGEALLDVLTVVLGWSVRRAACVNLAEIQPKLRTIWVNCDLPSSLRSSESVNPVLRYSLAHELAHIRLHKGGTVSGQQCELEADQYAAQFLMPGYLFRSKAIDYYGSDSQMVDALAGWFGVSKAAARIRLSELGLASVRRVA